MASQFDILLAELRAYQASKPPQKSFAKSLSPDSAKFTLADAVSFARGRNMARDLGAKLKIIAKSLAQDNAVDLNSARQAQFFKALGEARAGLGRRIAAGSIGVDDAIAAEIQMNRLADRAMTLLAERG